MTMKRIAIIGLGLIGGSLGLALKEARGGELEIIGFARRPETAAEALRRGAVDRTEPDLARAISGADLIILSTPVMAMKDILREMAGHLSSNTIVTDVGSTKAEVIRWAAESLPKTTRFIGAHPMTGKETAGIEGAEASLFKDSIYCLTPTPDTDKNALKLMEGLAEWVGAKPLIIDAETHDTLVAGVSHLPLLLSAALVSTLGRSPLWPKMAPLAATGYRDTSRLASGNPELHYGICATNRKAIIEWIDRYLEELTRYRRQIMENPEDLRKSLATARGIRQKWLQNEGRRFQK